MSTAKTIALVWGVMAATGTFVVASALAGRAAVMGSRDKTLPAGPLPTIRLGSSGPAVSAWQAFLGLPATGSFDEATHAATQAWQAAHGLTADGVVGPLTWAKARGLAAPSGGGGGAHPASSDATAVHSPGLPPPPPVDSSDSGRTWAKSLPANATPEREAAILAAVDQGFYHAPALLPVSYTKDGRSVTIYAWGDCLAIGLVDPIRVNVRHPTAQRIADRLGLMLPTSKMSDAAWQFGPARIAPQTMPADALMGTTARMTEHSDKVSLARTRAGLDPFGSLCRPVGKDWVNTERLMAGGVMAKKGNLPAAANFGWQWAQAGLKSPGGLPVLQSVGLAHTEDHTDYSQVCTLYGARCIVDGVLRSCAEVLQDPDAAYLLSDEVTRGTACRVWRYPAVPPGG